MFFGEFERGLDRKGRMTLPASMREALGDEGAIVTRGLDGCLFLFPRSFVDNLRTKLNELPLTSAQSRDFRRYLFSGAGDVTPDGQGRINIPPYLREFAELDGGAVVIGNDTYAEIWNPQRWLERRSRFEVTAAADEEAWAALGI